ncbi:MAG: HAD family phosphatase [Sedimentisphaerales bacterium]|nr:HAD family phosphatase [Sedimentisphaerales bacterium]
MLKAVIFDFDGVIADSEPLHCQAFLDVLPAFGIKMTRQQYYEKYLGYSDAECIDALSTDFDVDLNEETSTRLMQQKMARFEELARGQNCILDGIGEFVAMLQKKAIRLAICSGAFRSDIDLILDGTGLAKSFEVIVTAEDVRWGKPHPEGYMTTLVRLNAQGLNIEAEECAVIEDSFWGLDAARKAGMKCVAVSNTYPAQELVNHADLVVDRLDHITWEQLQSLQKKSH